MDSGIFLSKSNVFSGDCGGDLHNRENEPARCLHYHDFYEFFVYLGSSASFVIDGTEYAVSCGDIVLVDMFTPHMMVPGRDDNAECFVAHVNPELLIAYGTPNSSLLDLFQKGVNCTPVHSVGKEDFIKYQNLMDEYRAAHKKRGQGILIKAIIHLFMAYAYSDFFSGTRYDSAVSRSLPIVMQIIQYINTHLSEKFSLQTLAKEINYSGSYLCHLFKQATNKTISSYIQEKRIDMAAGLLSHSTPINKVAEMTGFHNYSHFYKKFKKQLGCSPAEYRIKLVNKQAVT
ncbi:MAG: Regulatory protein SoxS [Firmicutes bacterium ADurb.Bin182]|nr:MAG: Regulatory protein SoxS [Firmicutes bacterium ADurb.Bin182]